MRKGRILLVFICSLLVIGLAAQPAISLQVSDQTIGSKDAVEVSYEFKNISNADLPALAFDDWDVNGPSYGQRSSNFNGNISSTITYTYTLFPKHIGTLKVPGFNFDYKGQMLKAAAQTVKVLQKEHVVKKAPPSTGGSIGSILQGMPQMGFPDDIFGPPVAPPPISGVMVASGQTEQQAAAKDFFIKITPSKSTFYLGEPILVDYEFLGAVRCNWRPERFPSFSGFSVADIERRLLPYDVSVNDRNFRARGIRKVQLVALTTGKLPLDSASVSVEANFIDASNHADRHIGTVLIKSKPATVEVLPLPTEGQPANFSGAIGDFKVSAQVDQNQLPAGENNVLRIRITGAGNLDAIAAPEIKWPEGVQAYDATDSQSVNKTSFPMQRTLEFSIPFIGSHEGAVRIPGIVFNYFNPETKSYLSDTTDAIQIAFSAPIKDNRVSESLAQHHLSNRDYLWIVAGIAMILALVFGVSEAKKRKAKKQKTAAANADSDPSWGSQKVHYEKDALQVEQSGMQAAETQADHLQYLPKGLQEKVKAKTSQVEPTGQDWGADARGASNIQSRRQLRAQAIEELRQLHEPKEFFVLAKALIIEDLQDKVKTKDTDEQHLLEKLSAADPSLAKDYKQLIDTCNKSLYLPVGAAAARTDVLQKIEQLCGH